MTLRTVFVDFGGTLALETRSRARIYAEEAKGVAGLDIEVADMAGRMKAAALHLRGREDCGFRYSEAWFTAFIDFIFGKELEPERLAALRKALFARFADARTFALLPGARELCEELRAAGLKLAVVSNWSPALGSLLRGLELDGLFDEVFTSAVERLEKPDPRFFELALQRTGADPSTTVHVGNDAVNDGDGARAAGIEPLLVHVEDPGPHPFHSDLSSARESLLSRLNP